MPELPEVETVLQTLKLQIKDKMITDVIIKWPRIIANIEPESFAKQMIGQHFRTFDRHGKYLIFGLDDHCLIAHLRMEGKFYLVDHDEPFGKHSHVAFTFSDHSELRYNDTRKFGRMYLYDSDQPLLALANIGLDPWDDKLDANYLLDKVKSRHITLKQMLLDQSIIAGIGNIYADEICFACLMSPNKKVDTLTVDDCDEIIANTRLILTQAIAAGGTTIRSYTSSLGISGRFQQSLNVHTRQGQACHRCQGTIIKTRVANRGTYYCPNCQKE